MNVECRTSNPLILVQERMQWNGSLVSRLNRSFDFECVQLNGVQRIASSIVRDRRYVSVVAALSDVIVGFTFFSRVSLASIARFHGMTVGSKSKPALQRDLLVHVCSSCPEAVYIFKSLTRDRKRSVRTPISLDNLSVLLDRRRLEASRLKGQRRASGESVIAEARERDTVAQRHRRDADRLERDRVHAEVQDQVVSSFPVVPNISQRNDVIRRWQEVMDESKWIQSACAVCGQRTTGRGSGVTRKSSLAMDFTLLRNSFLPEHVLPNSYNLEAYDQAILCSAGLHSKDSRGDIDICSTCHHDLVEKEIQPKNSLANFQYYGYERLDDDLAAAFEKASLFELMLVSRCRATRITYLYSERPDAAMRDPELSQRYTRGNVAIIPQDSVQVRPLLPPGREDIRNAVCALFVGGTTVPTLANIESLSPVLVSKMRVFSMIDFLIKKNPWYSAGGAAFSQANFDDLFHPRDAGKDIAVLRSAEIGHLPSEKAGGVGSGNADYTDRGDIENVNETDELAIEAVGYTEGDHTPQNYKQMKAVALAWCLDKKKFIRVRGAMSLLDSRNPGLLSFLFPHLDPWGIGGFHNECRTPEQTISFQQQVKNMLNQHNSPFERDPNFAFICWNLIQRADVNKSICFRVPRGVQRTLAQDLKNISPVLSDIILRWHCDPSASPVNDNERKAVSIINRIKLVAVDLKGSSGYKLCRRNEIRSLTRVLGTPALFITLNPADVMNPLMGVLGGISVDGWRAMSKSDRLKFVANHPGIAARFFDTVIRSFIDIVVRPGKVDGYFGHCTGYYGMVEAQGKGTLHLHLVLYLKGNPNPQELRDRMSTDPEFKGRMFTWLEAIVSCELPGMTEPLVPDVGEKVTKPVADVGSLDPRMQSAPLLSSMSEQEFQVQFRKFVEELAIACNWHNHTDTCWKHLKGGEKRSDASCRMGINGSTRAVTELDEETLSILLRRLHPRINNFNDVVLFLLRCNMDIKYIGSGQAAKALVYYVTDYMTKSNLTTHAGLDALLYAIRASDKILQRDMEQDVYKSVEVEQRGLLIKSVNAMMARQETSHQQVMSYLVGGGDYYTSHRFRTLRWRDFDRYMAQEEKALDACVDEVQLDREVSVASMIDSDSGELVVEGNDIIQTEEGGEGHSEHGEGDSELDEAVVADHDDGEQEDLFLTGEECLEINSQVMDYRFRPVEAEFEALSLWEFVGSTELIGLKGEEARLHRREGQTQIRGRRAAPRGRFSSDEHPKVETHMLRLRVDRLVPVLLGPNISRPDGTDAEYRIWCRAMLVLFRPWRSLFDLLGNSRSWVTSYETHVFPESIMEIIKNFGVERQCKDARDEYTDMRRRGAVKGGLLGGLEVAELDSDGDSLDVALINDARLDERLDMPDGTSDVIDEPDTDDLWHVTPAGEAVRILERARVFRPLDAGDIGNLVDSARLLEVQDREVVGLQTKEMNRLRANKRPSNVEDDVDMGSNDTQHGMRSNNAHRDYHRGKRRRIEKDGEVLITALDVDASNSGMSEEEKGAAALETIIDELGLKINPEQERAVRIVGEHLNNSKSSDQLLMYVGGPAGTGKTYVIDAIVRLFEACGRSEQLLLGAPTGCAAVLIGGFTVHALTMLPRRKDRDLKGGYQQLVDIWKHVKYLIIDEVSMISALFLSQVSERMCQAKSWDPTCKDKPFGGVNVIFLGDFGQLKPVRALALFSHFLINKITPHIAQNLSGQSALHGAFLWRSVSKVVLLKKNMRSMKDPAYTALLERLRVGNALQVRSSELNATDPGDYDVLLNRTIGALASTGVDCALKFKGAPVIAPIKTIRDAINDRMLREHAAAVGQVVHCYRSRDKHLAKPATGEQMERLWRVRSSFTKDSLGLLYLFVGMEVMITDNVAISQKVVNGSKGVVVDVLYEVDDMGYRYATCVYVKIKGSGIQASGLERDVVPIMPVVSRFKYISPDGVEFSVSRKQVPLLPAYSMTDYKSQGQGMDVAIVDLNGGWTVQSLYVMLSRLRTLDGLGILRWFPPNKLQQRLSGEFRTEFERLEKLDALTTVWFRSRNAK